MQQDTVIYNNIMGSVVYEVGAAPVSDFSVEGGSSVHVRNFDNITDTSAKKPKNRINIGIKFYGGGA
jgi:hypothetical protein